MWFCGYYIKIQSPFPTQYPNTAVSAILHNPPTTKFYAGTALVLSAVPLSQMLETEEADPSTAFHRTYSSASEDSVFSITPSTSMDSQRMRRAFGRERDSVDSMASSFESQTAICDTDCSDAELSLNPSQQRLLSQSSASSDGGGIMFSPPAVPIASGALPRRDPSSSTSLTTVPEHAALPGEFMQTQNHRGFWENQLSPLFVCMTMR